MDSLVKDGRCGTGLCQALLPQLPKILLLLGLIATGSFAYIAANGTLPNGDAIMYALPIYLKHGIGGVPLIGDFPPYSEGWGHHWPGSFALRYVFFSVVPYSIFLDNFTAGMAIFISSVFLYRSLRIAGVSVFMALTAATLFVCDPISILATGGFRPEPFAALGIALFSYSCASSFGSGTSRWVTPVAVLGSFISVTCHPFSGLSALILGIISVICWFLGASCMRRLILGWLAGGMLGCVFLIAWFAFVPGAWESLTTNIKLQTTFWSDSGVIWQQFSNAKFSGVSGQLFLVTSIASSLLGAGVLIKALSHRSMSATSILLACHSTVVLVTLALYVRSRSLNDLHLLAIHPAMICAILLAASHFRSQFGWIRILLGMSAASIAVAWIFFVAKKPLEFSKLGSPNIPNEISEAISKSTGTGRIIISHGLWPTLSKSILSNSRLWTFPVASSKECRQKYERSLFSELKSGDVMYVEENLLKAEDPFGLYPVYSRNYFDAPYWKVEDIYAHEIVGPGHPYATIKKLTYLGGDWPAASGINSGH